MAYKVCHYFSHKYFYFLKLKIGLDKILLFHHFIFFLKSFKLNKKHVQLLFVT